MKMKRLRQAKLNFCTAKETKRNKKRDVTVHCVPVLVKHLENGKITILVVVVVVVVVQNVSNP